MSTKNDKSREDLEKLANVLINDFGSIEELDLFWHTHSRRSIDTLFKLKYDCSYYYAKKIFLDFFGFSIRTPVETKQIQKINADNTKLKRYGRTNVGQFGSIEFTNSILNKYGVCNVANAPEIKEKKVKTCLQKYGVVTNLISTAAKAYKNKKYCFDNCFFDSSWELALWIYAKDHNEQIVREPIQLSFTFDDKEHFYTPDFNYNNCLIEIKGSQFLDPVYGFKNPYDKSVNELYQAKYNCIIQNNVKIWSYADIKPYLLYIKNTYGKNYLKQFRITQ